MTILTTLYEILGITGGEIDLRFKAVSTVTYHNSVNYNIECLLYFLSLFQVPNHWKKNKGDNIIV